MEQIRGFFRSDISPGFVPFGADLTHFGAKPTIPDPDSLVLSCGGGGDMEAVHTVPVHSTRGTAMPGHVQRPLQDCHLPHTLYVLSFEFRVLLLVSSNSN